MARFDGKVTLISGGARGQGAAEARALVAEGGKVVIGDVLEKEGAALARSSEPPRNSSARTSPARPTGTRGEDGGGDGRAARPGQQRRRLHAQDADGDRRGAVGAPHPHQPVRLLPRDEGRGACDAQAGGGSIVNISSGAGLRGSPLAFAYSATKWALRGMTKSAAMDLARRKIRVNSVHPGPIETEMIAWRTPEENGRAAEDGAVEAPRHRRRGGAAGAVPAVGREQYITGAEVAIDGGITA